jgi:hypothetical protein
MEVAMDEQLKEQYDKYVNKHARLSNGSLVDLRTAAAMWDNLRTSTMNPTYRSELMELRYHALQGTALPEGQLRNNMEGLGFVESDGRVKPDARNVILSSLTGDRENTHVVSPFTEGTDLQVAEFLNSVTAMKGGFNDLLSEHLFREVIGETWMKRIQPPQRPITFSRN